MRVVKWLLHADDLVPFEITPRRARRWRALLLVAVIAFAPKAYVEFQQEKWRPTLERMMSSIIESVADADQPDGGTQERGLQQ